jgi:hypothetical protein
MRSAPSDQREVAAMRGAIVIVFGLVVIYGAWSELIGWLRSRRRLIRVTGVVVGHVDPGAAVPPGSVSRSAAFEFQTETGRRIRAVSSAWSYPGPRIGRPIPIRYDPRKPASSAERAGVLTIKLLLTPVLLAVGTVFVGYGITLLN